MKCGACIAMDLGILGRWIVRKSACFGRTSAKNFQM
jgi:hypothetical protein